MAVIRPVATYGNPDESPGQADRSAHEPGRFPEVDRVPQPGHSDQNTFAGYEPSKATIVRDRHAVFNRGSEKTGRATSNGGGGLGPDPLKDGPAHPSLRLINRSFNPQQGTDNTHEQDDLNRGYRRVSTGQYAGTQDGSTTLIFGGTPGMWIPYGSYAGYARGPTQGIQGPEPGAQGDGRQLIPNSPPHGLHSDTMPGTLESLRRTMATAQQRPVRADRPANSPIAGQSFSQTVLSQAQMAIRARNIQEGPSNPPHLAGSGWRGM